MVESSKRQTALCYTYDSEDSLLLEKVLPHVQYIETTPDTISRINTFGNAALHEKILEQLVEISNNKKIVAHGVGLSIGTFEGMSEEYLTLLDELINKVPIQWHSEHLGYTMANGEFLNVMLPVNRNKETLAMICDRINTLQDRYQMPFLIENIAHLLPDYQPEYSEAEFLNAITSRTGCGLILDLYNISCDAYNFNFDIPTFLDELNLKAAREIHIANGSVFKGRMVDIHSNTVSDEVLQLTEQVLNRTDSIEFVTFELMPEAVPGIGYDTVEKELIRIRETLNLS
jgi:uncharacterized protein (UPF0276 family)